MRNFVHSITSSTIFSIGDAHGQGRKIIDFIQNIDKSLQPGQSAQFIQLGDLCDCFAPPTDSHGNPLPPDELRKILTHRIQTIPGLAQAFSQTKAMVDWRRFPGSLTEGTVHDIVSPEIILRSDNIDVLTAFFEATMSFETLACFSAFQIEHPQKFSVIFGNHDADLLRGHSDYGRQQKYLLWGLLGFSPDETLAHMQQGTPEVVLRHPWINWLNQRPHIAVSQDTLYMHGGPTGILGKRMTSHHPESFSAWLDDLENARRAGWEHPEFTEHQSFLSPDGADNDWIYNSSCIADFCDAAQVRFLAVGHSPFLDFPKGPLIDLKNAAHLKPLFHTPALLPPDGRLIKHDTNLKRGGELWACCHQVGTDVWTGISQDLVQQPIRRYQKVTP